MKNQKDKRQRIFALLLTCILLLGTAGCTFGTAGKNPEEAATNTAEEGSQSEAENNYGQLALIDLHIVGGEDNWTAFKKAAADKKGTEENPLSIQIVNRIDNENDEQTVFFDGESYIHNGRKWKLLLDVEGLAGIPEKMCRQAVLANDVYTYKELEWSVISSNSKDWIEHDLLFYADGSVSGETDNKADEEQDFGDYRGKILTKTSALPTEGAVNIGFEPDLYDMDTVRYFVPKGVLAEEKLLPAISGFKPEHEAPADLWKNRHTLGCSVTYDGITWELVSGGCLYTTITNDAGETTEFFETPDTNWNSVNISDYVISILGEEFNYEPADVTSWTGITTATLDYHNVQTGTSGSQTLSASADTGKLATLEKWLSGAKPMRGGTACPFNLAKLTIYNSTGNPVSMMIATDSCSVFRVNGVYYDYRPKELQDIVSDTSTFTNQELKEMFDQIPWEY